jgi:hypothetical protein
MRMRREITTNLKFKNADKCYRYHNVQKYNLIFLLISCLALL